MESKRGLSPSLALVAIPPSWSGLVRGAARATVGRSPCPGWQTSAQGQLGTCPGVGRGRPARESRSHYQDQRSGCQRRVNKIVSQWLIQGLSVVALSEAKGLKSCLFQPFCRRKTSGSSPSAQNDIVDRWLLHRVSMTTEKPWWLIQASVILWRDSLTPGSSPGQALTPSQRRFIYAICV